MPRLPNLRQIEAFQALIENGTVSRAAELLNISQPAMSRLIAHLELDTGLRLFDRVKGRLAPTPHALRLHDEVGRIFSGIRQVQMAVEAIRREEQGQLAIGAMAALAGSFLQRATALFMEHHPNLYCSIHAITSQWIAERLVTRKLDVGLVSARIDNPYIVMEPLMEHALVCIMPPGHPLSARIVIEPQDLDGTPFVTWHSHTYVGQKIEKMFETYDVKPRVKLGANVSPTVCEFVAGGLGVALVHPLMVSGFEDKLVARRFEPEIPFHFQLCRSTDSRNAHLIDAFAEDVRTTATQISRSLLDHVSD